MRKYITLLFVFIGLACFAQVDTTGNNIPSGQDIWTVIQGILTLCDIHCPVVLKVIAPMVIGWIVALIKHRKKEKAIAKDITATLDDHKEELPETHKSALQKILSKLKRKNTTDKNG